MAVIEAKIERFGAGAVRVTWPNMKNGDVGQASGYTLFQDRSVQVRGTFGAGGAVTIQGTNEDPDSAAVEFVPLTDMRGNNLNISQAKIEQIEDCSYALRPVVAGDATTDLTVVLFARGS